MNENKSCFGSPTNLITQNNVKFSVYLEWNKNINWVCVYTVEYYKNIINRYLNEVFDKKIDQRLKEISLELEKLINSTNSNKWINYKYNIYKVKGIDDVEIVLKQLMSLYYENYNKREDYNFLNEINTYIRSKILINGVIYIINDDEWVVMSLYSHEDKDKVSFWWLNSSKRNKWKLWAFLFYKTVFSCYWDKKKLNTITYDIDWKNNKNYKRLLKIYSRLWFHMWTIDSSEFSRYINIYMD